MREVIAPTIRGLEQDGTPYTGFLYAGLMIGSDGAPMVVEFNCRFGDPEAQPMLARLRERSDRAVRGSARPPARSGRGAVGRARGGGSGAGRGRLSRCGAQRRRDRRPGSGGTPARQGVPRRHAAQRGRRTDQRRAGAVRGGPGQACQRRAARSLRAGGLCPLRGHAVPPRHRLSRDRARARRRGHAAGRCRATGRYRAVRGHG